MPYHSYNASSDSASRLRRGEHFHLRESGRAVVADCIARMDGRAFLPIPENDFNRIEQGGPPVRAQRVANVSTLRLEAIISRSGTDRRVRRDRGRCSITSVSGEMGRPRLDIVQTTLMTLSRPWKHAAEPEFSRCRYYLSLLSNSPIDNA